VLIAAVERRVASIILFSVFALTLIVTPWLNLDPINLPKLFILLVSGFALLGNLLPYLRQVAQSEARLISILVLLFFFAQFLAFLLSDSDNLSQIYGTFGRSTGLLAYVSLAMVLLATVLVSNYSFAKRLIWVLIATGIINAAYGLIQWVGLDPIDWSNPYNPIVGTLGNPNFTSAHLGIAALASLALLFERSGSIAQRSILIANIGLSLFIIYKSDASQGLLVFALGFTLIFYYRYLHFLKVTLLKYLYWLVVATGIAVGAFGILNRGPLASLLYQDSVSYRGDYWRAGLKMSLDNPIVGVGLDSYGNWYRFYRDEAATLRRGPDVTSNSAHNVFLDISSNGGFILLITYLMIIALVARSAVRVLRKSTGFDGVGLALITSWIAYLIQSIISINQLGLAIWGWVLGGAIIGYDFYKDRADAPRVRGSRGAKRLDQVPPQVLLTGALGIVVGVLLAIWPVVKDASFRAALVSSDAIEIERAVSGFPQGSYYYTYAADIFLQNKLEDKALEMAKKAIEINPRDFNAWKLYIANPSISQSQRAEAIAKMKELDPFNNTLQE
jgi:O-antigen ligase